MPIQSLKTLEESLSKSHVSDTLENQKMERMADEITFLKSDLKDMTEKANSLQKIVEKSYKPIENDNGFRRYT